MPLSQETANRIVTMTLASPVQHIGGYPSFASTATIFRRHLAQQQTLRRREYGEYGGTAKSHTVKWYVIYSKTRLIKAISRALKNQFASTSRYAWCFEFALGPCHNNSFVNCDMDAALWDEQKCSNGEGAQTPSSRFPSQLLESEIAMRLEHIFSINGRERNANTMYWEWYDQMARGARPPPRAPPPTM